ncbi:MAG: serine/threonine protein kinase [Verrucomicrobiaceae bacterium]|nr:MAG: serine/threonine protein kinase [Verrucomicrobiaceae bacterium]
MMPLPPSSNPSPPRPPARGLNLEALAALGLAGSGPGDADMPSITGWRILERLGTGGSAVVWKAETVPGRALAALKIPIRGDTGISARLMAEADSLRALRHPHIVRLLDAGTCPDGGPWLALEYVEGAPLSMLIPNQGYGWPEALRLFRAIASGVEYAHSQGVLHRDLKPANILLGPEGAIKVADFGLSRPVAERVVTFSLSVSGHIAGTAEYLAPECYQPDHRSGPVADIYALGVILYEILSGHPPRGAWSPVSRRQRVDIRVDDVIQKALDPDPSRRFPSVQAMLDEVNRIAGTPPRYAGTPRLTRAVRFMDAAWTLAGLFLLLGSLGMIVRLEQLGIILPLDLMGSQSERIGVYQAVLILLTVSLPFTLWQIFRLWHFRKTPLREALPSPFGLRLGTSRLAAAVILLTQALLVVAPAVFGSIAWSERCLDWIDETYAPWIRGLVITVGTDGKEALNPWDWMPEGPEYWIRERAGWLTDPAGRDFDKSLYIPGLIPRYITTLALIYLSAGVVTALSALARWWRFRKWRHSLVLPAFLFYTTRPLPEPDFWIGQEPEHRPTPWHSDGNWYTQDARATRATRILMDLLLQRSPGDVPVDESLPFLDGTLRCGNAPPASGDARRAALLDFASGLQSPHRQFRPAGKGMITLAAGSERFLYGRMAEDMSDLPDGSATGALTLLLAWGRNPDPETYLVDRLDSISLPLWSCESRALPVDEAAQWAEALMAIMRAPAPDNRPDPLREFFLPVLLWEIKDMPLTDPPVLQPPPSDALIRTFRNSQSHGSRPRLVRIPDSPTSLPGGRRRVLLEIDDRGHEAVWTADLVYTGGKWKCARLGF